MRFASCLFYAFASFALGAIASGVMGVSGSGGGDEAVALSLARVLMPYLTVGAPVIFLVFAAGELQVPRAHESDSR